MLGLAYFEHLVNCVEHGIPGSFDPSGILLVRFGSAPPNALVALGRSGCSVHEALRGIVSAVVPQESDDSIRVGMDCRVGKRPHSVVTE